jgi:hypothetical protein
MRSEKPREAITQCSARKRGNASLSALRVRRALMWLILPPQLFLRPAIRGGKRGRRRASQHGDRGRGGGLVAARLQQWENGEQIGLIQSLRVDRLRAARSTQSRAQRDNQSQTLAEGRGTAGDTTKLELIGSGTSNKAATQLASLGVLSASDPAVVAQLRQKHPQLGELPGGAGTSMPTPGEYDMPAAYGEDHPDFMRIDHAPQLAEDCRALKREKAAAPNGGKNDHYQLFGSAFPRGSREERAQKDLAFFGGCYLNALLPPWYYRLSRQRPGSWPSSRQSALQARRRKCGRWQWAVSRDGSSARHTRRDSR